MTDIEKLKEDYNKFAKKCFEKGVNPYDIFTTPMGGNKELFDTMLSVFNKHLEKDVPDNERTKIFEALYEDYRVNRTGEVQQLTCGRQGRIEVLPDTYKREFVDVAYILKEMNATGYFEKEGGKLKPRKLDAKVDNLNEVNKLVGASKYKLYEGIITPDGTLYVSLNEHTCMCMYMIANGVDIKGSLRITQMPNGNRQFSLSSCNYLTAYGIKGFEEDKNLMISDQQAQTLYKFFKAVKSENKAGGQTFMQILARSVNFGWDFVNVTMEDLNISLKHAKYNMMTLEDNLQGEFDGKALYKQVVQYSNQLGITESQN